MPGQARHLIISRSRRDAVAALAAIPDAQLLDSIGSYMVPWLNDSSAAWNANEPESETTIAALRVQIQVDIDVAYGNRLDDRCDRQLAVGLDQNGRRMLSAFSMYHDDDGNCSTCGNYEDDCECNQMTTPVDRLNRLNICTAPLEAIADTLLREATR